MIERKPHHKRLERGTKGIQRTRMKVRRFNKKLTEDGASLRDLKNEMDRLVRTIVALRDNKCATCWAHSGLQVGHLFRRGIESVRWNLLNCAASCPPCNSLHETEPKWYIAAFINKHGQQAYAELKELSQSKHKFTYIELLAIRDGLRRKAARVAR